MVEVTAYLDKTEYLKNNYVFCFISPKDIKPIDIGIMFSMLMDGCVVVIRPFKKD